MEPQGRAAGLQSGPLAGLSLPSSLPQGPSLARLPSGHRSPHPQPVPGMRTDQLCQKSRTKATLWGPLDHPVVRPPGCYISASSQIQGWEAVLVGDGVSRLRKLRHRGPHTLSGSKPLFSVPYTFIEHLLFAGTGYTLMNQTRLERQPRPSPICSPVQGRGVGGLESLEQTHSLQCTLMAEGTDDCSGDRFLFQASF